MYQNNVNFCFPLAVACLERTQWTGVDFNVLRSTKCASLHAHHNLINQTKILNQAIAFLWKAFWFFLFFLLVLHSSSCFFLLAFPSGVSPFSQIAAGELIFKLFTKSKLLLFLTLLHLACHIVAVCLL